MGRGPESGSKGLSVGLSAAFEYKVLANGAVEGPGVKKTSGGKPVPRTGKQRIAVEHRRK